MAAVFPNGIKNFPRHANFVEAVDAETVNALQDEVTALEQVVGSLITEYQDLETDVQELITEDTSLDASIRRSIRLWRTLRERLEDMTTGQHMSIHECRQNNITIPHIAKTSMGNQPTAIKMAKPTQDQDPFAMYNGYGFTLHKSGYWHILGHIQYALPSSAGSANEGTYIGAIGVDTTWTRGMHRQKIQNWDSDDTSMHLRPTIMGWFPRGTKITLRTAQCSSRDQVVTAAYLSGFRVRADMDFNPLSR